MNVLHYGIIFLVLGFAAIGCGPSECPVDADLTSDDIPCTCGSHTLESTPKVPICQCSSEDSMFHCTDKSGGDDSASQ
jgi:hypothetical protein